jgi:hypothetical protein
MIHEAFSRAQVALRYATPYRYAKLCGVSTQAIYDRIKNGSLTTIFKDDLNGDRKRVIDLKKFPPGKK